MTMLGQYACGCGCTSVFGVLQVYVFDYARGVVSGLTACYVLCAFHACQACC